MDRLATLLAMERATPTDPFLKYALAMEYVSQGNMAESRRYFERLVTDYPDYVATYYQYGKLEEEAGNTAAAETLYKVGIDKATAAGDKKTAGELRAALEMMD
ncbi:MAG: tetratricopeptide repeat protein [Bacteroidetes bacterium]|nr:tetratricopeptide repeat protein [Bacteroidota bacterium]